MVNTDDTGRDGASGSAQGQNSGQRTQSERKRFANRREYERKKQNPAWKAKANAKKNGKNKANHVYQEKRKAMKKEKKNAKKHEKDRANPEKRALKNAKKHAKDKVNREHKAKKNTRKNFKNKANPEYQARKNAKKHVKDMANPEYQASRNIRKNAKKAKKQAGYPAKTKEYERLIKLGHDRVCVCCGQLFGEKGVSVNSPDAIHSIHQSPDLAMIWQICWIKDLQMCITCNASVVKGKVPKLRLGNGLDFPPVPEELKDLSELEQRMVSGRIPFQQVRELRPTTQLAIRGNIVNVPIDVEQTVSVLPREFDKTSTIQLSIKRKLEYKTSYIRERVRPYVVHRAADYLVKQPLYQEEGITISVDFLERHRGDNEEFVTDKDDENVDEKVLVNDEERWDETKGEEDIMNPEDEQTLIKEATSFAPGEGRIPMSISSDEYFEELSFPAIYCGHKRQLKTKLTYSDIAKSEVRRYDRRCCGPVKLFVMFRKKEMLALRSAIQINLKMAKNQSFTVEQAMDNNFIEQLIRNNDAYRVLAGDRTSPVYWSIKNELMAMIRTLGIPTFFLTLSAAETRWPELIVILVKVLENRVITEEETEQISWEHKCNLIRKDPVTCARYFDRRMRELFKLIKTIGGPFGDFVVEDFYIRIEFQHRGSPHVHSLLWLKDSPKFDKEIPESRKVCEDFIDRFITCRREKDEMENLYALQFHKHTTSCKRQLLDKTVCQFGIPQFPMPRTAILNPLAEEELTDEELDFFPGHLNSIKEELYLIATELTRGQTVLPTFEEFLQKLGIEYSVYERIIRTTLKRPKIFLRRGLADIRTNAFNEEILRRHRANMDLQYVLDPYACVHYILDYINKSNRGKSRLVKQAIEEVRSGNKTQKQKLHCVCSKFINSSEVSAQEAVYILLSMPLSHSSRASVFINTGEKQDRVRRFKYEKTLKELGPESTDVLMDGLLEYYVLRPDELENLCLAEFASCYDYSKSGQTNDLQTRDLQDEKEIEPEQTVGKPLSFKEGKGILRLRKVPKVIRYRRYQKDKEPLNYYRDKLILYIPWRDEDKELVNIDQKTKFDEHLQTIMMKEDLLVKDSKDDYLEIETQIEQEPRGDFFEGEEDIVPDDLAHLALRKSELNFDEEVLETTGPNPTPGSFLVPKHFEDSSFEEKMSKLNEEQRHFVFGLLNHVKTSDDPFLMFLTGGAGTGKSVTIEAVYQTLIRWFARQPGCRDHPDLMTVLLVGPTEKSAFPIGGTTIHSAFGVPVTQNKNEMKPMSAELKNRFRNRLWNLKVIIIDEVSMVGAGTLRNIHIRLQEIFVRNDPFAGRSVLFVGDLNQLKPVMDSYVFKGTYGDDLCVLAGPVLWQDVKYFRLNTIMRQRNDQAFAEALNHLASGHLTEEDKALFQSRLFATEPMFDQDNRPIRLFRLTEKVERFNRRVIEQIDSEMVYKAVAQDRCNHPMTKVRDQAIFSIAHLKSQQTYGLPKELDLAIGIRYMVSINIDIEDGLVNGSSGVLRAIDSYELGGERIVQRAWLEFDYESIGHKARSGLQKRYLDGALLTPISRVEREIPTKTGSKLVRVSRRQFPLVVCEAITIHKSQGQSYDQVVVDVRGTSDVQLLYTAFSRARTAEGLYLIGQELKFPQPRSNSHPISVELARLEREAKWSIPLPLVSSFQYRAETLVIGYQNLPHLRKHSASIVSNHNLSQCDLLCFVETHSQSVNLDGFRILAELPTASGCQGIVVYSRSLLTKSINSEVLTFGDKAHFEYMAIELSIGVQLLIVYSSPKVTSSNTIEATAQLTRLLIHKQIPLLVLGDFNLQIQSSSGEKFERQMKDLQMKRITQDGPTTDFRTTIDWVFANIPFATAVVYESFISDHKPVIIAIK